MKNLKIKWVVDPAPTGPYRSFQKRGWPNAHYVETSDEKPCAAIYCEDNYYPRDAKSGNHKELTLRIMDWSGEYPKWRTYETKFKTLHDVKIALPLILDKFQGVIPRELKEKD